MNNEPVAWRTHYPSGWEYKDGNPPFELKGNSQLLYTHPAKPIDKPDECIDGCPKNQTCDYCAGIKTLTDEEILEFTKDYTIFEYREFNDDMVRFARAILRKAQEK